MTADEIAAALPEQAVLTIDGLPFPRVASGKVREIFDLGDALLLVATDRLSAFDVILPDGIPGKGAILTQISNWWFAQTAGIIRNHLLPDQAGEFDRRGISDPDLRLRSMVVRKLKTVPVECVARGYLAGSGWESYRKTGEVCGIALPPGLQQASALPEPIFTPTTKAPKGQHDEPIDDAEGARLLGQALYDAVKAKSLELYRFGHDRAILAEERHRGGAAQRRRHEGAQQVEIARIGFDDAHVEAACNRAATGRRVAVGGPHGIGHEVIAEDGNAGPRDGPYRCLIILDLLVAAIETEHG